jgi:hypothetical protein
MKTLYTTVLVLLYCLTVALTPAVGAQLPTGTILGVVSDPSGAVVPGANVTIRNVDTGSTRKVKTENDGSYRVSALPAGNYEVQVAHEGFSAETRSGVTLTVAQNAVVNISLRVGATSQTVSVTEAAPSVDTTTATLGGLVNNQKVQDLPLNGRNYLDLALLQTGVNNVFSGTQSSGIGAGGILGQGGDQFTSNGATVRSNNYMLDGAIMQNGFGLTPTSSAGTSLGLDGIQEFKVITNLFGAEYGLTMGSQTVIASKSGTNNYHGDAFEFVRNSAFDAKNFFDTGAIPHFSRNQFGVALGGPIKKDKTFFFATFERLQENLGLTSIVPGLPEGPCHVAAGATVNISNVPGPGICYDAVAPGPTTATMNPVGAQLLALAPLPNLNVGQVGPFGDSFTYPHSQTTHENHGQIRVDETVSPADSFFLRYTIDDTLQHTPSQFPGPFTDEASRAQYLTASETHTFSSAIINTARFSYSRFPLLQTTGAPSLYKQPIEVTGAPFTAGFSLSSFGATDGVNAPQNLNQFVYTLSDDFFWNKGKHSFKFGTLINHFDQPQGFQFAKYGGLAFGSISDLINGVVFGFTVSPPASDQNREYIYNTYGFYAEDDWRVARRLTLDLGLRYEPRSSITNSGGPQYSFRNFGVNNALNAPPAGTTPGPITQNNSLHNFSPRIGFAWDVFGDGRTAVRGGGGIYYDLANIGAAASNGIFGTPPTSFQSLQFGVFVPVCLPLDTCFPVSSGGPYPFAGATLSTVDYYAKQPSMTQYNLTIEHQFPRNTVLSVSYVGSRGIHLWNIMEGNPAVPDQMRDPQNPLCSTSTPPANCSAALPRTNTPGGLSWTSCVPPPPPSGLGLPTVNPLLDPTNPNACRVNPYYSDYTLNTTRADSWYNSLQLSFQKVSGNWQFQTSYTYSKLLDDGQGQVPGGSEATANDSTDPFDPRFDRGPSEYDVTHQLEFNTTYHLPNLVRTNGFASKVLNGWWTSSIFTARSGFAFSPYLSGYLQSNSQNTYGGLERPDFVTAANIGMITDPNCPNTAWGLAGGGCNPTAVIYNKNGVVTGNVAAWFNPNMFIQQPAGYLGEVPRGILRGPGFVNWDFSLAKDTKVRFLGESGAINFRTDVFDILNHPNFAAPNFGTFIPGPSAPAVLPNGLLNFQGVVNQTAGTITATANTSRQIQVSIRLQF